jgi:hypothetical protein
MSRAYRAAKRAHEQEPVTFDVTHEVTTTVDGAEQTEEVTETFTCRGGVSTLLLSEFARQADLDAASPEGMALVSQFFRQAFGEDREYRRFLRYQADHNLDDEMLMSILAGLVEDLTGRPTKGRQPSLDGPSTNGSTSKADSSLRVVAGEVEDPSEKWASLG